MVDSLKIKTVKGTLWSALERFSVQGVSFIVMIVMARMLTPKDYGLVGMLAIFIAVSQSLVDCGFSQALIRKQDRTEIDNSTVFFFNIGVGLSIYIILFLSAPIISNFFKEPVLVPLMRLIGLSVIFNSLVVVQRALLTIEMDFKTQAKASLSASIVSGVVGISMACLGFGVWAIVAYQLVNLVTNVLLLWIFSSWRPRMLYSWNSFRNLFGFGSKLAISGIIDTIYRNIYLIVIGKVFNASDLGYYTRASQFAEFPSSNITGIMQRVTFPVLCTIQEADEKLRIVYRKFLRLSAFVIFPMMIGLAAIAKPLVIIVLKEKWAFAGDLLSIICFSMMWSPIHAINLNLLQVKGRSDLFLKLEIIKKIIGVLIIIITMEIGIEAMCWGSVINSLIALIINTHYTGKLIGVGFFKQIYDLIPTLIYSFTMGGVVWLTIQFVPSNWMKLIGGIVIGVSYFVCVTYFTESKDLKELFMLIKRK